MEVSKTFDECSIRSRPALICDCSTTVSAPAFQAGDASSILVNRSIREVVQLVECLVWDQEVARSNRVFPTQHCQLDGFLAQLEEHLLCKQGVASSSLARSTETRSDDADCHKNVCRSIGDLFFCLGNKSQIRMRSRNE